MATADALSVETFLKGNCCATAVVETELILKLYE